MGGLLTGRPYGTRTFFHESFPPINGWAINDASLRDAKIFRLFLLSRLWFAVAFLVGVDGRGADDDGSAFVTRGFYLEGAAEKCGAFAHADETETLAGILGFCLSVRIKAHAVVLDDENHVILSILEKDIGLACLCMLEGVV